MDFEMTFFQMIRFAPERLTCDDVTFIDRSYRDLLGREPEFDPAERVTTMPPGDLYESRTTFLYHVVRSVESQTRGYAAMVDAVATLLSGRNKDIVAGMIRTRYPSIECLMEGLGALMAHARDNSRRQDGIIALAGA